MSIRGAIKTGIPIVVAIVGWFVTPIIKAKMDGTALNGLPGILNYWKHAITSPVPLTRGVSWVTLAGGGGQVHRAVLNVL